MSIDHMHRNARTAAERGDTSLARLWECRAGGMSWAEAIAYVQG